MPEDAAERAVLLQEIAELEAELARAPSTSSTTRSTGGRGDVGRKRVREAGTAWGGSAWVEDLLRREGDNRDLGLSGPGRGAGATEGEEEVSGRALKRAEELIADNAELTGLGFTSATSDVTRRNTNSLLRKHTISGKLASSPSPVNFTVHISVREPTAPLDEAEEAKRDPGREYVVEKMECEVKGGGSELRDALSSLRLDKQPNPPAFFSLLRQYALLSNSRKSLLSALSQRFPETASAQTSKLGAPELVLSSSSTAPSLTLSYGLEPSTAPTAIRLSRPLVASLSLTPQVPPSIPSAARETLQAIPSQLERMLHEGVEPVEAVAAVVKAVFGE